MATDPTAIAACLAGLPAPPTRLLLETGGLTPWLWHELGARGLVVHCIDARRAKAQLALRPAKTARNDARGLAEIARMGWYANVRVKRLDAHALRAKLAARRAVLAEVERLDRVLLREARDNITCRRLMTVPGVGPITALAYQSTIEDPSRFGRGRDVGAYVGLVPRRHQSGEVDRCGRISKQGDALLRGYLYEAATVLISRLQRPCALQAWARALAERIGMKKARVALARKLAVLLHHLWSRGQDFRWAQP